ncbi:MAG: helix-turn-helix transcriptional regulator [Aeromicrobium sp.]|uniref:helix-turn-helix domain-containing protein n=1 Tax=Aeromicrobium sp. TaxID=1871063 RepID=UPI0039E61F44
MAAKSWREVRAAGHAVREVDEAKIAGLRDDMLAEVRAHRLAEVRKAQRVSQAEVATAMGVSQPRVSQIERGVMDAAELGTLRAYVEALGGRLRVVADFGDQSLTVG